MSNTDIGNFYDSLIEKYGASFQSADVSSQEALEARWKVLSEVTDLTTKSVLDVGCGWGHGYTYLQNRFTDNHIDYTGIDISSKAIKTACHKFPFANFKVADLAEYKPEKKFDIVVAQGIFYKLPVTEAGAKTVYELISHMVRLSKEAVAFTAVCSMPYGHSTEELRIEPHAMLDYLRQFSSYVTLRMDYWQGDCMFALYKNKQGTK